MNFKAFSGILLALQLFVLAHGSKTPELSSLSTAFTPFESPNFCSQIITPTCNTTFSYIDELNKHIRPFLTELVRTSFFKYFKLDLDKQCKFWNAQHFCATENCAVEILPTEQYNWSEITNDNFKPSKLGEINRPTQSPASDVNTCEDLDYSHFDEGHECVYVNLLDNPERFTGYGGSQSFDVWKAIYSENCFPNTNPFTMTSRDDEPEKCTEKILFYRLISGMHASIAVHLSNEYLDANTGKFYPNLEVFMERVGKFNDRLSNIYFNYALVTQAIVKLNEFFKLADLVSETEPLVSNEDPIGLLDSILPSLAETTLFDSSSLFNPDQVAPELKNEFRSRFKNVSAIMDCVGCDRCRMWGKLQTIGYGTALKILFEMEDPNNMPILKFRRIELVALFNTFDRLSKSIEAINNFKVLYIKHLEDVAKGIAKPGVYDVPQQEGLGFPFAKLKSKEVAESSDSAPSASSVKRQPVSKPKTKVSPLDSLEKKTKTPNRGGFTDELNLALKDVWIALKFIYQSYVQFPKIIFNYSLVYLNGWWNVLIGKQQYTGFHTEHVLDDDIAYSKVLKPI